MFFKPHTPHESMAGFVFLLDSSLLRDHQVKYHRGQLGTEDSCTLMDNGGDCESLKQGPA